MCSIMSVGELKKMEEDCDNSSRWVPDELKRRSKGGKGMTCIKYYIEQLTIVCSKYQS